MAKSAVCLQSKHPEALGEKESICAIKRPSQKEVTKGFKKVKTKYVINGVMA